MSITYSQQAANVAQMTKAMDRDHGLDRMLRKPLIQSIRRQAPVFVAIDKIRCGSAVGYSVGGGYKCESRDDNTVTAINTKSNKGQVKCCRSA